MSCDITMYCDSRALRVAVTHAGTRPRVASSAHLIAAAGGAEHDFVGTTCHGGGARVTPNKTVSIWQVRMLAPSPGRHAVVTFALPLAERAAEGGDAMGVWGVMPVFQLPGGDARRSIRPMYNPDTGEFLVSTMGKGLGFRFQGLGFAWSDVIYKLVSG